MVISSHTSKQRGTTMIEVLVTIVILTLGLLGMAGLQARLQVSEMESYQRTQALILLEDMANRIATNRSAAATYVTGSPLGAGTTCSPPPQHLLCSRWMPASGVMHCRGQQKPLAATRSAP